MAKAHSIPPFPPDIGRSDFGHWLSGFTDGEGCFQLDFRKRKFTDDSGRVAITPGADFIIGSRADDRPVLELIRSYWQCGGIYHRPNQTPTSNPAAVFSINATDRLIDTIIPHFERYPLRAKKARDFVLWKQGVEFIASVISRPRTSRGYRAGTYPRWSDDEKARFHVIATTLREQRRYRPEDSIAPLPTLLAKEEQACLFD